jgi:hypothetical protein
MTKGERGKRGRVFVYVRILSVHVLVKKCHELKSSGLDGGQERGRKWKEAGNESVILRCI